MMYYCILFTGRSNQFYIKAMFGNNQDSFTTWQTYIRQMPKGYKGLIVSTLIVGGLGFLLPISYYLANIIQLSIFHMQIWRLFTSFLVDTSMFSLIFDLFILSYSMPMIEKTYSTSYVIIQIFLQTFICNAAFIALGFFFNAVGTLTFYFQASWGLYHLVFIFLWRKAAADPLQLTRFCFFPCLMPLKYLPWCFLGFSLFFGINLYAVSSCLLGYFQFMVFKKSFIKLPLSVYRKLQSCLPESFKKSYGFITTRQAQSFLKGVCYKPAAPKNTFSQDPQAVANDAMNDKVEVIGKGVTIGSSSQVQQQQKNYKNHWLQEDNNQVRSEKRKKLSNNFEYTLQAQSQQQLQKDQQSHSVNLESEAESNRSMLTYPTSKQEEANPENK